MDFILYLLVGFVVLDVIIVVFVILRKKRGLTKSEKARLAAYWRKINEDGNLNRAVMDADKLLDKMLSAYGYSGSVGDKLKKSGSRFSNLDGVWSAHKLRNRIAHEIDLQVSAKEAKDALKNYAGAFRDLGLL